VSGARLLKGAAAALDDDESASMSCSRTLGALLSRLGLSSTGTKEIEELHAEAEDGRRPETRTSPAGPEPPSA
jgi:hypothetical protein